METQILDMVAELETGMEIQPSMPKLVKLNLDLAMVMEIKSMEMVKETVLEMDILQ